MNTVEIMLQGRVESLLAVRRRMRNTIRIRYQNGQWQAASDAQRARTRCIFRIINKQLRRAAQELVTYQEMRASHDPAHLQDHEAAGTP